MRKGVLLVRVRVGDRHMTIANTHLSANMTDDWTPGNPYARVEADELGQLAAFLAHPNVTAPLIVAGDFNVPRDSPILGDFLATTGLVDVMAGDEETTYRPTPELPFPKPIDQVLATPQLSATTELVFKEHVRLADGSAAYLSDHYGIGAAFSL